MLMARVQRRGMSSGLIAIALSFLVIFGLASWFFFGSYEDEGSSDPLVFYCAAGIKKPVADTIKAYLEEEFHVPVSLQYGGSGTLLSNLQVAKQGDLYLAADVSYIQIAREKGLLAESIPLAIQKPVIAVPKGNPKNIKSIADFLRSDVSFALANPEAASIGKLTKKILEKTGDWEKVFAAAKVTHPTVNDLILAVKIGKVDAAVVWDANVRQQSDLEMVTTPEFDNAIKRITIGVLKFSKRSAKALQVARYLQAPEKGQQYFVKHGYEILPDADVWEIKPTMVLYSGGVNRPAIDQTIKEFEKREGVTVNVSYNGCGILVAQMKSGSIPDAYFACDTSFMKQVKDIFLPSRVVSETDMVMIVKKGNPLKIGSLNDLTKDGIKLAVSDPVKSALGSLTKDLLENLGLYAKVRKNIEVSNVTADLTVNQIRTGSIDVGIVYRANVSQVMDYLDVVSIDVGNPIAMQPIAVGKNSSLKYLAGRLVDAILSRESKDRFQQANFRWRARTE